MGPEKSTLENAKLYQIIGPGHYRPTNPVSLEVSELTHVGTGIIDWGIDWGE